MFCDLSNNFFSYLPDILDIKFLTGFVYTLHVSLYGQFFLKPSITPLPPHGPKKIVKFVCERPL